VPIKTKSFGLFHPDCRFTDDSALTVAIAQAIHDQKHYAASIRAIGRRYPDAGYGGFFMRWLFSNGGAYNSFGNGAAMRVSPVGFAFNTQEKVLKEAAKTAEIPHNQPEGIKGAQATSLAVFLARTGYDKEQIRQEVSSRFHYNLNRSLENRQTILSNLLQCLFECKCLKHLSSTFIPNLKHAVTLKLIMKTKNQYLDILKEKTSIALKQMESCALCPRECRTDRLKDETGVCRTGRHAVVAHFSPHHGEENCLVGRGGSGTIFFSNCNLLCNFCQNYDISHLSSGGPVTAEELSAMMLKLQNMGCENINVVTPSHVVPQMLEALLHAREHGLTCAIVYNSSGYDKVETLQLLEGIVDIYMPDFKFWSSSFAGRTAHAPDYPERARRAVREMNRQVGDLVLNERGIATKGLLVRHLVMPNHLSETRKIMRFLMNDISKETAVNVMGQYRPCGKAYEMPDLRYRLSANEYQNALNITREEGVTRFV